MINFSSMKGFDLKALRESFGISRPELALATKIPYGTLGRWENNNTIIKDVDDIRNIQEYFESKETGEGEMFNPKKSAFEEGLPQYHTIDKIAKGKEAFKVSTDDGARPYYNIDFTEGFEKIFEDEGLAPSYYINYKPCEDVGWWLNVTGNGMHPHISNGDIIAVKKVENWQTFLMPDEIYGIITVNGLKTIRTVCFGNDQDYFSLVPSNKNYQTVEIPKNIISTVLKVRTVFKKAF